MIHEDPYTMDVLPPIPYVLCVHGQCWTSMGHSKYTGIISIQAIYHPIAV